MNTLPAFDILMLSHSTGFLNPNNLCDLHIHIFKKIMTWNT